MILAKPPIVGDVASLVGDYAEKVDNRSLRLKKFSIHKSWPVDPDEPDRKWDDASRWSFIRVAENGLSVLERELNRKERLANGAHVSEEKRTRHLDAAALLRHLKSCACRRLDPSLAKIRKDHVEQFVTRFADRPDRHIVLIGKLCASLAVNLSDSLIQNAGICLDRLFGEPYVSGSAVKGVSRHVALSRLKAGMMTVSVFQKLFGTADVDFSEGGDLSEFAGEVPVEQRNRKGGFDFLAAHPISDVQVAVDMTNVHYPDYYQSGQSEDLSKEKPRPNPFPVTAPGADFAFCIASNGLQNEESLGGLMREIVREALETCGLGAKTAAGYGWFDCSGTERWIENYKQHQIDAARQVAVSKLIEKIASLAAVDVETPAFRTALAEIEADPVFADLPSRSREELVRQKRRLPQQSPIDRQREQWRAAGVNAVIGLPVFARKFNILAADRAKADVDEEMRVTVQLLREGEGIGAEVWRQLKAIADDGKRKSKFKHIPNVVGTIRELSKTKLDYGRMP